MSKARMCDRCKRCFNPSMELKDDEQYLTGGFFFLTDANHEEEHKFIKNITDIDLCPKCTKKFLEFVNNGAKENANHEKVNVDILYPDSPFGGIDFWNGVFDRIRKYDESHKDVCNSDSSEWESDSEEERED